LKAAAKAGGKQSFFLMRKKEFMGYFKAIFALTAFFLQKVSLSL
jgi:hypothetical protein